MKELNGRLIDGQVDSSRCKENIKFLSPSSVPSDVGSVSVFNRKETEITLQWIKVDNHEDYTYELEYRDGEEAPTTISTHLSEQKVDNLASGTEYLFTLYTLFNDVKSSGYNFSNVTSKSQYNFSQPILTHFSQISVHMLE